MEAEDGHRASCKHDESRSVLGCHRTARPPAGWHVLLRRDDHRRVLPPFLPLTPSAAAECPLLRDRAARPSATACARASAAGPREGAGRSGGGSNPRTVPLPGGQSRTGAGSRGPRGARRPEPLPPAAKLQSRGRGHAQTVPGSLPHAEAEDQPARGDRMSPMRCTTPASDRRAASTSAPIPGSGMTPKQYRQGGRGVAITLRDGGVAGGPDDDRRHRSRALLRAVRRGPKRNCWPRCARNTRPPRSSRWRLRTARNFAQWIDALTAHLAGNRPRLDLPLDIRATAFQMRVWNYLQSIPVRRGAILLGSGGGNRTAHSRAGGGAGVRGKHAWRS